MKLRILGLFTFLAVLSLGIPAHKASAHEAATQGSMTAILHIEPDDYPPAGQPETIYFIFDDAASRFRLADCSCKLTISQAGTPIFSTTVAPPLSTNTIYGTEGIPFTFSDQTTYNLALKGQPITSGAFKPFQLAWNITASAPLKPPATGSSATIFKYFAAIVGVLALAGLLIFILS